MSRPKNSVVKLSFMIFPILAVLCCWPAHGMNKVKKVVSNVESSFNKDMEILDVPDVDACWEMSEARKTRTR